MGKVIKGGYGTWVIGLCARHVRCLLGLGLAIITAVGGYLRLYRLDAAGFWIDEAFSVVQSRAILEHGYPLLSTGEVSWTYFPAHYLIACGIALFGDIHIGARFLPAMAGTLLIPVFFWFNLRLTRSRLQALLATALLAVSTYEIAWSRQARGYMFLQLAGTAALGTALLFAAKRKWWILLLASGIGALCPLLHPAGYFFLMVMVGWLFAEGAVSRVWPWCRASRMHMAALLGLGGLMIVGILITIPTNASVVSLLERIVSGRSGHGQTYIQAYLSFLHSTFGYVLWLACAGALIACYRAPRKALPVVVTASVYFLLVSCRISLLHYRYMLPLVLLIPTGAAIAVCFAVRRLWDLATRASDVAAGMAALCLLALCGSMDWNVKPYDRYFLGLTAPQPEWRAAYEWVRDDHARTSPASEDITTISTFPVFHDIYIGKEGSKFFLPVTLTGRKRDTLTQASYTKASTIRSVTELRNLEGYVVLDEMGFKTLGDPGVQMFLGRREPHAVIPGFYEIRVWKIPGERR